MPLLSVSDLFLMPSVQESFGLAALEAMACEVPVVASRIGGVPDLVEDGVTGFLCAADDLAAMAQAGIRILTDEALHRRMAQAARARAAGQFADTKIVPMYEAYYDEVLAGKAGARIGRHGQAGQAGQARAGPRDERRRSQRSRFTRLPCPPACPACLSSRPSCPSCL